MARRRSGERDREYRPCLRGEGEGERFRRGGENGERRRFWFCILGRSRC